MNTEPDGKIFEFEEKPKQPKSTKASMGIYIFNKKTLFDYLIADENNPDSSNDFGKNIIPEMLKNGEKMYAYDFSGYWKDVGTIQSLWEANMDLLGSEPNFNIADRSWRIFFRNNPLPPHFVGKDSTIKNSIVTEGCEIYGTVENSVIFNSVKVAKDAVIKDSVILPGVVIEPGAVIEYSIVDADTVISAGVHIGERTEGSQPITVIGSNLTITKEHQIKAGDMVNAASLEKTV